MRVAVRCGGLTSAADACREANLVAAMATQTLATRLAGTGGMAGADATSEEFATAYDAAAASAVSTLAELTHAFIGLGRLLAATAARHERAESASADGVATAAYTGAGIGHDHHVRVSPAAPPTSLGGTPPDLGRIDLVLLDLLEGFVWPGTDTAALTIAAHHWRAAASAVDDLPGHLGVVAGHLEDQHSPEVWLALDAVDQLRDLTSESAERLLEVAGACEDYTASVAEAHARTKNLLSEVGAMVVEGVAVSAVLAGLSGGLAAGAGGTAVVAKVRSQAPRFHALLAALRATASVPAARLRIVHTRLDELGEAAGKFARARVRDERGELRLPGGRGGAESRLRAAIDDPSFDPEDLRALDSSQVADLLHGWRGRPAARGSGWVYEDPLRPGRQIRVMDAYPGNRPDSLTHQPYVVVSQNGTKVKVPLEGGVRR